MDRRNYGPGDWGKYALEQLRGPVADDIRNRLAAWRDPRARLLRRRRRAKRLTVGGGAATGVFGGGAYLAYAPQSLGWSPAPPVETLLDLSSFGLGGMALAAGVGTLGALRRYRRLKRTPLPEASPRPARLPASGSVARQPMRRLREAETDLRDSLNRLAETLGYEDESVADARSTAASVAGELRTLAERLEAVESTVEHAPGEQRADLEADVRRMRAELDEGIERYGALVAAAGRAVAASRNDPSEHRLQEATDRLAGLSEGLRELNGEEYRPDRRRDPGRPRAEGEEPPG
ncbi:phage shock envelope stress response protein PspM [Actinopolyspora mortivallis]|uniref:Uncharacterized protein n=1 Tax=Actinopolyspora mortivallis TaxID=33906 RepID=A0A2T0GZ80_ACTMO|nr:hypothetical protein [Actinopolyspora mortivallis]PRW64418.1 hypothetical protein CEP50_05745 [Actinopolyspora mortivallis]